MPEEERPGEDVLLAENMLKKKDARGGDAEEEKKTGGGHEGDADLVAMKKIMIYLRSGGC